jgi:hypothetical protein
MFMTLPGLLIIFAIHVLIGMAIGTAVTVSLLQKRTTWRALLWAFLAAIVCWIYALHLSDLVGVSGYQANGKWEMLPWREGTHWQNLIGDHAYLFAFVAAVLAAAATVLIRLKFTVKRDA